MLISSLSLFSPSSPSGRAVRGVLTIALVSLVSGCPSERSDAPHPVNDKSMRPNDSRKVKVVFVDGVPQVAGSGGALPVGVPKPPPPPEGPRLTWDAPKDWEESPPTSNMRLAQFKVPKALGDDKDAELIVYYFGPQGAGDVEQTFTRWSSTFEDDALKNAKRTTVKAGDITAQVLEVAGTYRADTAMGGAHADKEPGKKEARLLGALVATPLGPYYFKLIGPDKTVSAARDKFIQLLESSRMGSDIAPAQSASAKPVASAKPAASAKPSAKPAASR